MHAMAIPVPQTAITQRPPQRSIIAPDHGAAIPPKSEPTEMALAIAALLQPNSNSNDCVNAPSTGLKNVTEAKDVPTALPTISHP